MSIATRLRGIGLILLAGSLAGCGRGETKLEANTAAKAVPVTVAPVELRTVERTVDVVGTLKGWEEVTIGSKRMGRVMRVLHDMGDRVKPGELLVLLETTDADLAVAEAEKKLQAELAKLGLTQLPGKDFDVSEVPSVVQSRVALERARQNLARERSLNHRGASTVQDLQNAENDEKSNEAALENSVVSARSTLATAQATKVSLDLAIQRRADMEIRAPVPSVTLGSSDQAVQYAISKRQVAEGQMVKEGDAVAELIIENPVRLWANVPERFSADIKLEQVARVTVAAHPGRVFEGKVARINPSIDTTSRTFQAEIWVPNEKGLLRPGGFAKASILTHSDSQAVTVPLESIVRFAGVSKVFYIEADKAREAKIETALEGPGWVEVVADLPPRAMVVTSGQSQLANGTPVTIRKPELTTKPAAVGSLKSSVPDTGPAAETTPAPTSGASQ